jgi:multimeric flavodoxin WrbA
MKHLLIVYHSQSGKTQLMADAVERGARHHDVEQVEVRCLRASNAGVADLLWADGLILGTPENFGYMSGALKDFLDRTFYPCEGKLEALPFAVFVGAGNDGTGALTAVRRIVKGLALKEVQPPIVCATVVGDDVISKCEELGTSLAAGLEMGLY